MGFNSVFKGLMHVVDIFTTGVNTKNNRNFY